MTTSAQVSKSHRGSRRHILDWVERSTFLGELQDLASPAPCAISQRAVYMPRDHEQDAEARLESFGPRVYPDIDVWPALRTWWLRHRGNTPNWDLAAEAQIDGRRGLVLVEAKANHTELGVAGKRISRQAEGESASRGDANDACIREAIESARVGLSRALPGIRISADEHYQLANRIAFAWKLASLGVPVVLIYLGFFGDTYFRDGFSSESDWKRCFAEHLLQVCPSGISETPIDAGAAPFWVLCRARPVLSISTRD